MDAPWILLFAKAPIPGAAKTRLAAKLGPERALEIHRFLAERQMRAIRDSGLACIVWTTPAGWVDGVASWLHGARSVHPQPEGDLGVRMEHACRHAFAAGAPGVVLAGTDCPDLDAARLIGLSMQVGLGRFAIQPALDGGYVAFGLPRPCPEAFLEIPWSTDRTLERTLERLHSMAIVPVLLEPLSDIDTVADWHRWTSTPLTTTESP